MRALGRTMQIFGLAILPVAMVVQLLGGIRPAQLLVALVFGFAAFYLGRMIEGYAAGDKSQPPSTRKRGK